MKTATDITQAPITDDDIRALRYDAGAHGDPEQVALCHIALGESIPRDDVEIEYVTPQMYQDPGGPMDGWYWSEEGVPIDPTPRIVDGTEGWHGPFTSRLEAGLDAIGVSGNDLARIAAHTRETARAECERVIREAQINAAHEEA